MTLLNRNGRVSFRMVVLTQVCAAGAFLISWMLLPDYRQSEVIARLSNKPVTLDVRIESNDPIRIASLYDDPNVVSDEELAAVLKKVLPRFSRNQMRPNYIEHALRIWGDKIEFTDPGLISGPQMREFLTDTSKYRESWGADSDPILQPGSDGISIRWGSDRSASVHHDHLLASLTEAGVSLDRPVFTPRRSLHFRDVLTQAMRDFQLDERETEWSVMAFGFWLAPQQTVEWHNGQGRRLSFDLLADRLMRNHKKHGVCLGTHRVYSLMVLLRLDEQYGDQIVSDETEARIMAYLTDVRDLIVAAQSPDGSWPPNWTEGAEAAAKTDPAEKKKSRVISTGHHLEWLAIAPPSLHPDRSQVVRAADWAIEDVLMTPQEVIEENYTFYSHVGNSLALWRKTTPAEFWENWRKTHPDCEELNELSTPDPTLNQSKK